ncbi:MAG: response regulator [Burkholderiaceae bacterium]|nr:response regulator [Burkholderiaceae bacterium]
MMHAMREDRLRNPVHHVGDGEEALEFLRRSGRYAQAGAAPRPDLVLLDLRLPGMSGLEVLRTIKSDDDLSTIPVVVLTSSGDPDDVTRAYSFRANSYVAKPLDFERFRAIVRELDFYWSLVNRVPQTH